MSDFDYVKMLEMPVNSCDVVYKPSKKKRKDVKKQVIEMVNCSNDLERQEEVVTKKRKANVDDNTVEVKNTGFDIISVQVVAIFVLIVGIILTNIFFENSGMNNLFRTVFNQTPKTELSDATYTSFTASLPSRTDEVLLDGGVMTVSGGSVYSPCDGTVESIIEANGKYTVTVRHSESFSSVLSGLECCYLEIGENTFANVPLGYASETFTVSMFNGDAILTGYTLADNQIVWLG